MAVSYTHLDVYKRQVLQQAPHEIGEQITVRSDGRVNAQGLLWRGAEQFAVHTAAPVSYTHLDVYKRQVLIVMVCSPMKRGK